MSLSVLENHHPLIRFFVEEINFQGLSERFVRRKAGLAKDTVASWRRGGGATLANFYAALNVLGYRLKIVDLEDEPYDP